MITMKQEKCLRDMVEKYSKNAADVVKNTNRKGWRRKMIEECKKLVGENT